MRAGLWETVVKRDATMLWVVSGTRLRFDVWYEQQPVICLAPYLEPTNPRRCAGKQTVDHVKDAPRMAKKAPDDEEHLVALCEAHNVWYPPSRALREAERHYLLHDRPE